MKVVGLMSGTSADGVDAALVDVRGRSRSLKVRLLAFASLAYPPRLRDRIVSASTSGTVTDVCHLNALLGEYFARAALKVIRRGGLQAASVRLIGSHGQTLHHMPKPVRDGPIGRVRSTLQIAEPAVIAERTGILTIADFRPRDMAAGGEGAPLTPYVHYLIFRHPRRSRLIVNLGGIGNATYLPKTGSVRSIQAFDTGPGNMVLDGLIRHFTRGAHSVDRGGRLAAKGIVHPRMLRDLLGHPFLHRRPPKSTGREEFGEAFLKKVLALGRRYRVRAEDTLATNAFFTAATIAASRRWLGGQVDEVLVGGGGTSNRALMSHLHKLLAPIPVRTFEATGWPSKAFEAAAFAVLAYLTMSGECGNVPSVTGARKAVVLGTIVPGRRGGRKAVP